MTDSRTSETIWSEDYVERNPKLAAHAIEFLQEMLFAEEQEYKRIIAKLKQEVEALEWELRVMAERDET